MFELIGIGFDFSATSTSVNTCFPQHCLCFFMLCLCILWFVSMISDFCVCLVVPAGIGPVLGLLFIPLIGSASDQCNSSYGRRRPFIWLLSMGVLLALFIIPHADVLAARVAWGGRTLQVCEMFVWIWVFQTKGKFFPRVYSFEDCVLHITLRFLRVPGGLPDPWCWAPWLLWTSLLHTAGGSSVRFVSGWGGLQPSLCHVLLHGELGRLCGLFATCAGLESRPPLCLLGRPSRVPLFPPHPHLHLQCANHHEGVRGTLLCQQRCGRVGISTGAGDRCDGGRPVWRATLVLLPAEVQAEAPQVWTPDVLTEDMLVHDAGHLQELLPRSTGDEAAVRGSALQLDGCHVFYAFLHRLCGWRPLWGRAQCITRECVQTKIWWRSDSSFYITCIWCKIYVLHLYKCVCSSRQYGIAKKKS